MPFSKRDPVSYQQEVKTVQSMNAIVIKTNPDGTYDLAVAINNELSIVENVSDDKLTLRRNTPQ